MPRYDENKIFGAYISSITENHQDNKKPDADGDGVPDWADKHPGEDDNAKEDNKAKGKGKLDKLPPGLRKHMMKKGLKEHHEMFDSELLNMTVGDLLSQLEQEEIEEYRYLYRQLEDYLEGKTTSSDTDQTQVDSEEDDIEGALANSWYE